MNELVEYIKQKPALVLGVAAGATLMVVVAFRGRSSGTQSESNALLAGSPEGAAVPVYITNLDQLPRNATDGPKTSPDAPQQPTPTPTPIKPPQPPTKPPVIVKPTPPIKIEPGKPPKKKDKPNNSTKRPPRKRAGGEAVPYAPYGSYW